MHAATILLCFATSAFAYSVISPNAAQGWTNVGAQVLTWQRVATDPQNFTAQLTNQHVQNYDSQVLAALVDGSLGNTTLNPPAGGWPTGSGFRVNLVQDTTHLSAILAQSPEFNITEPTTTPKSTGTLSFSAASPSQTSASSDPIIPASGASSMYPIQTAFLGMVALLAVALA